jgi:predicted flavoprotein YhiN
VRALSGVAVSDVVLTMATAETKAVRTRGELLLTHTGLSGPAALDASRTIARALLSKADVEVRIDFAPGVAREALESALLAAGAASGRRLVRTEVARYVPASLAQKLCGLAGASEQKWGQAPVLPRARVHPSGAAEGQNGCQSPCSADTTLAALTARARKSLLQAVKECRVRVTGTDGFSGAMVTSGGVDRAEISARTLESTRVKGLFFAGEVVDVDGPCGGYNLQWAFSSGRLAGLSAAGTADGSS